jgi:hypothetical protein
MGVLGLPSEVWRARVSLDLFSDAVSQTLSGWCSYGPAAASAAAYSTSGTPSSSMPLPRLTGVNAV